MENAYYLMDFMYENEYEYDFEGTINLLKSNTGKSSKYAPQYTLSPIEMLYLKITQHEYIGNMRDIRKLNEIEKNYTHNIPLELVAEMKELHYNRIDINNFEQYLHENALRLSKYVYFGKKPNKEDVRKIRKAKEKFLKWLDFRKRAKPLLNPESICNELQLVSFLQAVILDDSNEIFDYAFHGYDKYYNHKPRVQAALHGSIQQFKQRGGLDRNGMERIDGLIVLLCRFFLYPFTQFRNPASDFFQQSVLLPYQMVFFAFLGHNPFTLHLGSGYAHVYGWYLFYSLSLIRAVVYPLRDILLCKVLIRNVCPCLTPYLGFVFVVPVCEVNFSRFETAVFQLYPLTVFV